ncbi:O-antigen polymerase [Lactiplantibacillus plantarum]|uniref:O-antigen polymerase n=1 Tax=Lactiplantibacillus plantarum TaxID=1590 RepID=UPI003F532D10
MAYLGVIYCSVIGIIDYKLSKRFGLLTFFCLLWAVIIFLSSFELYGMVSFSREIYSVILIGLISFTIPCLMGKYTTIRSSTIPIQKRSDKYSLNRKFFFLVQLFIFIFMILMAERLIELIQSGLPYGTVRAMYLNRGEENYFTNPIMDFFNSKLVVPLLFSSIPIVVTLILTKAKEYIVIILVSVLNILIYVAATGGRLILIYIVVDLIIAIPLYEITISSKLKKRISYGIIVLFFVVIITTVIRKGFFSSGHLDVSSLFIDYYRYLSLSVPLFAHWLDYINSAHIQTNGMATFGGIANNIYYVLTKFGATDFLNFNATNNLITQTEDFIPIFNDTGANAFVTMFFFFYLDFRMFGVIILSGIYGWVTGFISKLTTSNSSILMKCYYLLFVQSVVKSFVRWEFWSAAYILAFLFMFFFFTKGSYGNSSKNRIY